MAQWAQPTPLAAWWVQQTQQLQRCWGQPAQLAAQGGHAAAGPQVASSTGCCCAAAAGWQAASEQAGQAGWRPPQAAGMGAQAPHAPLPAVRRPPNLVLLLGGAMLEVLLAQRQADAAAAETACEWGSATVQGLQHCGAYALHGPCAVSQACPAQTVSVTVHPRWTITVAAIMQQCSLSKAQDNSRAPHECWHGVTHDKSRGGTLGAISEAAPLAWLPL